MQTILAQLNLAPTASADDAVAAISKLQAQASAVPIEPLMKLSDDLRQQINDYFHDNETASAEATATRERKELEIASLEKCLRELNVQILSLEPELLRSEKAAESYNAAVTRRDAIQKRLPELRAELDTIGGASPHRLAGLAGAVVSEWQDGLDRVIAETIGPFFTDPHRAAQIGRLFECHAQLRGIRNVCYSPSLNIGLLEKILLNALDGRVCLGASRES
jgi:hypothetical protein